MVEGTWFAWTWSRPVIGGVVAVVGQVAGTVLAFLHLPVSTLVRCVTVPTRLFVAAAVFLAKALTGHLEMPTSPWG